MKLWRIFKKTLNEQFAQGMQTIVQNAMATPMTILQVTIEKQIDTSIQNSVKELMKENLKEQIKEEINQNVNEPLNKIQNQLDTIHDEQKKKAATQIMKTTMALMNYK